MQRVLAGSNKVIIDSKGATAPIILPPDVFRPKAQAPAQGQAPTPQPQQSDTQAQSQARGSQ